MRLRKYSVILATGAALFLSAVAPAMAQSQEEAAIPPLNFRLEENFFRYPANFVLGRAAGVAVAPNGNIVTLNRGYHPVMEFTSEGKFTRSWGEGSTMFAGAHVVRFDPQGNLWYVDAADNIIFRFDKEGRTVGTLGHNPEPWTFLTHAIEHAAPPRGGSFYQETDIAWSKDGSIFVSDGYGNSRVAKFDKDGNFVKSWGERGNKPGEFNTLHSLVVDNNDVVYVADRGNGRIQTFDTEGNLKAVWKLPTAPWALCLTNGPNQVMFVGSVSRIYKMDLSGKILGAFGRPGRFPGTLDAIHQIACPDEKTLYVAQTFLGRFDKWVAQ